MRSYARPYRVDSYNGLAIKPKTITNDVDWLISVSWLLLSNLIRQSVRSDHAVKNLA